MGWRPPARLKQPSIRVDLHDEDYRAVDFRRRNSFENILFGWHDEVNHKSVLIQKAESRGVMSALAGVVVQQCWYGGQHRDLTVQQEWKVPDPNWTCNSAKVNSHALNA